jgi:putative ABC transport system permease protein
MSSLLLDLRFAWRLGVRQPILSLAALFTLAIGFGATTALYSAAHAWLIAPLPFPSPDRLVAVWETIPSAGIDQNTPAPAALQLWRERAKSVDALAAWTTASFNMTGSGEPVSLTGARVTGNLLSVLGVLPRAGRNFVDQELQPGGPRVAMISSGLWRRTFGGDPSAVGSTVTFDGEAYEIVGVIPDNARLIGLDVDVWAPLAMSAQEQASWNRILWVLGRLGPEVTTSAATSELAAILSEQQKGVGVNIIPLQQQMVGTLDRDVRILLAATLCVLLIACANVASLSLARMTARRGELAVRTAIGASRVRLARQVFVESLALGLAGAGMGLLFAGWTVRGWVSMLRETHYLNAVDVQQRGVLLFVLLAAVLASAFCALGPAWHSTRTDPAGAMRAAGRTVTPSRRKLMSAFVVAEVALALALLVAAGLVLRSYSRISNVKLGFDHTRTVAFEVPRRDEPSERWLVFYEELLRQLHDSPDVAAAGLTQAIPIRSSCCGATFQLEGRAPDAGVLSYWRTVSPRYFETLRIPLIEGRTFTVSDRTGAERVAIVSESFARQAWPGERAIGRRIGWGTMAEPLTVVGVAGDVRLSPTRAAGPHVYMPFTQVDSRMPTSLVVRGRDRTAATVATVKRVVASLDPSQPVGDIATMEDELWQLLGRRRFQLALISLFAGIASLLALVGIYGVLSFVVGQSVPEIGLRLALGAPRGSVLRAVLTRGLRIAGLGVPLGILLAIWAGRFVEAFLYEIEPRDPATLAVVTTAVVAGMALACLVPALRASRVDPLVALREE